MNLRYIDWIWNVRGSIALAPRQSSHEAFDRLTPLLRQHGTSHERSDHTLVFRKKDPVAQDKMSVFEDGDLQVVQTASGSVLRYHLKSRALLLCFLAPFFFLAASQLIIGLNKLEKPPAAAEKKKDTVQPMNPIDKFLGAPAPEDKTKAKAKKKGEDDDEAGGRRSKKPSPKPAYTFAGIFTALYLFGRFWEARLIKRLFQKALNGELEEATSFRAGQAARGAV